MKIWVAFAGAFLLLSACGSSKEAKEAVTAMNLDEGGHGYIRYDSQSGSGGKMTFKGVKIRMGDDDKAGKLKIDTMVFDGLKMSGSHAVFTELTLNGISPEFPDGTVPPGVSMHLDKIVLKNPNADMAKAVASMMEYLGDPKGKQPDEPDFQKWTFGQLLMGGLSVKGPMDQEGTKGDVDFHLNEVSMSNATNLHMEDPQFGKFLISGASLKVDHLKVESDGVEGKGELSLGEFSITDLKHMTEQKQEVGKVLLSGLSLKGEGASDQGQGKFEAGLREISLTDLKRMGMDGQDLGQFLISGLSFKGDGGGQGAKVHVEGGLGEISLSGLKSDLANGKVEFNKFLISNVSTKVDVQDAKAPGNFSFGLAELSGSNVHDSKLGSVVLAGLKTDFDLPDEDSKSADGKPVRIKGNVDFGTFNITNLNAGLYGRLVEAGATEASDPSTHAVGDVIRGLSSPIEPLYDGMTWTGMNASVAGFKFTSTKMEAKVERDGKGAATHVFSPTASIAFSVDPGASEPAKAMADQMNQLGLKNNVDLHFSSDVKYDPAQDTTRLSSFNMGSSGIAELTVGGGAKGLTRGVAAALEMEGKGGKPDPVAKTDLDNLQILDFDFAFTDQKLMELVFSAMAKNAGGNATVASMRADAAKQVLAMKSDMQKGGIDAALASDITTSLAAFVQKPGTLRIKLAPPRPVPFRMLGDKGVTKASIGFSATFTPAP